MSEKIMLIDGHSILNRAFFGVPDLTNSEGLHTNAVYGFLNIMFHILEEEDPDYLAVAFDRSEPTFRHKMYADYKGTRKPMAQELREQVPVIKEVLSAMDIPILEKAGYEADDILGTIARKAEEKGLDVRIISGDRDLLQLATGHTMIRIPKTKRTGTEVEDYLEQDVKEKYHVTPKEFIDVKALMGDSSDNIPGVPGIGEKTATALIEKYGSIENTYAHVEEVTPKRAKNSLSEHYDMAQMSKTLATIDTDAPVDLDFEEAKMHDLFTEEAYPLIKKLEFKNFLARFEGDMTGNSAEERFRLLDTAEGMDSFLSACSPEKLAVSLYRNPDYRKPEDADGQQTLSFTREDGENEYLYGAAVADQKDHVAFLRTGLVSSESLKEKLEASIEKAELLLADDLKNLVKEFSVPQQKKCFDTAIAAYLINPLKNTYDYDDIARDFLDEMVPSKADLFGKMKPEKAMKEDPDAFAKMACYEAYTTLCAWPKLVDALEEQEMKDLYDKIELPLVFTLADMELAGVRVDAGALKEYGENLTGKIGELEQSIYEQAGEVFNINSPKQLGHILFEKLGMPNGKKTKTGYSTAAGVLEKLAPDYPIVSDILEYRQLAKLKSTYADGLAGYIDPDQRIRSTFNQTITATGRISSTEPNLQNIPIRTELGRQLRKIFIPEEGCLLADADYSQIELRVLAHMSDDENLIEAYKEAKDIHRITASRVFHTPFDEVTPLQRRNAKAVNFGIVYGISSFGLSQDLSITRKEARGYIESYFKTYPGIKRFLDKSVADAKEKGYSVTLFGRRRPVPELKSSNFMQRSFGERVAMNAPIQGTAADIIKIAMFRVHDRLKEEGLKSRLILQVHDELLVEAPEDEIEEVKKILTEEMQGAAHLRVALEIDLNVGKNWYEAH